MDFLRPYIVALALIPVACSATDEPGAPAAQPNPGAPIDPSPPSMPTTQPPSTDPPAPGGEAVAVVTSCTLPAVPPVSAFDLLENESYGPDPLQTFDVAKPKGPGPFPLVIIIHSSG